MRAPLHSLLASLAALAVLAPSACTIEEPPAPPVVIPPDPEGCSTHCECQAEVVARKAFRLTRMEIDEPDRFARLLNPIWIRDIAQNALNVIFRITSAEHAEGSTAAFDRMQITAGPGWRTPKEPTMLPAPDGGTSASVVGDYCLLEGLSVDITLLPYHDRQCELKSEADTALYFHPGPKDSPLVCAPLLRPQNNIPVKNLKVRTSFNRDCTQIRNGNLEGCITMEDADHICMCGSTGTCPLAINEAVPFPSADQRREQPGSLLDYCHAACGGNWLSFGYFVRQFGLYPTCITPEGHQGYRLQGFFDAVEITDQFNPTQSADCSVAPPAGGR